MCEVSRSSAVASAQNGSGRAGEILGALFAHVGKAVRMDRRELLAAVDRAFDPGARGLSAWPDPRPFDSSPTEEEYSRVTNVERFRLIGCRADAWIGVLESAGLAVADRNAVVEWRAAPGPVITRTDVVRPVATGALPLVVSRSSIDGAAEVGVVLGAGDPAVSVGCVPQCGCDACDSGSQNELDELDRMFVSVVTGAFRRLELGDRDITVEADGWSASGQFANGEIEAVIANPTGWLEVSGAPW